MARTPESKLRRIVSLWEGVRLNKGQWNLHWEDLARYMLPSRIGFVTDPTPGDRRNQWIFDATAMRAARGLSNSVSQLLRPEGEKWVLMRAEDDALNNREEVQVWLKMAEEILLAAMYNPKARFRQASGEADTDLIVFGTAAMFIGESKGNRHLQYMTMHLKNITIAMSSEGVIDTVFQLHEFSTRQAIQKFGEKNLHSSVQDKIKTNAQDEDFMNDKAEYLRVIRPREDAKRDGLTASNLPWADLWIDLANTWEVSSGGFHEFPFAIPRWDTTSGEVYGRSPGMIALPDTETLNAMSETILVAGQKAADPSIFAPNDASFDAINSFSGGITYYDVDTATQLRGNPFFTIDQNFNLPITRDMQADTREQVEAAFFRNIFNLPVKGPEMTATEVITRKEEFIREIGPVFGRLESDYLAPIVERSFGLLLRMNAFPPIPEILQGKNIRFEYTSPVNKIREQAQVAAARLWMQEIAELSAIDKRVLKIPNVENIARFGARALDLPLGSVRTEDEVKQDVEKEEAMLKDQMERDKVSQEAEIIETGSKGAQNIAALLGGSEEGVAA